MPTALPPSTDFTAAADQAAAKTFITSLRAFLAGLIGTDGTTATARSALGLAIGTDVQAYDAATAKTNAAQTFTKAQRGAYVVLTDGATITPDFSLGNQYRVQLGGNRTLANPSNLVAGQSGFIDIYQDSTGGRTLNYQWGWQFPGGTTPVLSTVARAKDKLAYSVDVYEQAVATVSIATPGVVTWNAHGLLAGQPVQFSTTGALPTGLAAATTYFVVPVDANSFQLSATQNGAAINTTGSQSGVHTLTAISITASLSGGASGIFTASTDSQSTRYGGDATHRCDAEISKNFNLAASSSIDVGTCIFPDNYSMGYVTVEAIGITGSGAQVFVKAVRRVAMTADSPVFTTIGTDDVQNCSISFSYVATHGFKATVNNSTAANVNGSMKMSIVGGGGDGVDAGIVSLT